MHCRFLANLRMAGCPANECAVAWRTMPLPHKQETAALRVQCSWCRAVGITSESHALLQAVRKRCSRWRRCWLWPATRPTPSQRCPTPSGTACREASRPLSARSAGPACRHVPHPGHSERVSEPRRSTLRVQCEGHGERLTQRKKGHDFIYWMLSKCTALVPALKAGQSQHIGISSVVQQASVSSQ